MNRNTDQQALPALGATDCISLAAAPTFAVMALLSGILGGEPPDMLCSAVHGASPLSGMVLMYLLMSAFHSGPWLKLISRRRRGARWSSHMGSVRPALTIFFHRWADPTQAFARIPGARLALSHCCGNSIKPAPETPIAELILGYMLVGQRWWRSLGSSRRRR